MEGREGSETMDYPQQADISEWFGIATNLAFRNNPCGQEVRGAPSSGWGLRPRLGMYLLNVYSIVKEQVRGFCL